MEREVRRDCPVGMGGVGRVGFFLLLGGGGGGGVCAAGFGWFGSRTRGGIGFLHQIPKRFSPGGTIGSTHGLVDQFELFEVVFTGEDGFAEKEFGEDAARGPNVDFFVVGGGAVEEFGGAVPEGYYFVG